MMMGEALTEYLGVPKIMSGYYKDYTFLEFTEDRINSDIVNPEGTTVIQHKIDDYQPINNYHTLFLKKKIYKTYNPTIYESYNYFILVGGILIALTFIIYSMFKTYKKQIFRFL